MLNTFTQKLSSLTNPKKFINKKIREKAITNAKLKLMNHGLTPAEAGDKFEIIVQEEEQKIKSDLKDKSIAGVLLALGVDIVMGM